MFCDNYIDRYTRAWGPAWDPGHPDDEVCPRCGEWKDRNALRCDLCIAEEREERFEEEKD